MIGIPAGEIVLRDEGTKTNWKVEVGAFRLAPYPVTRELYRAVRGQAPVSSAGPRTPVAEVSWKQAVRFCNLFSQATGLQPCYLMGDDPDGHDVVCDWEADGYRLPSEAEWECTCRAGTSSVRYGELDEIAWYRGNSGGEVHDVATKAPNAWGLYDMIGNVWEWCWDVYDPRIYGPYRVFRGGGSYDRSRGEVVTDIDSAYAAMADIVRGRQEVLAPDLGRIWSVTVSPQAQVRTLTCDLPDRLRGLQQAGACSRSFDGGNTLKLTSWIKCGNWWRSGLCD